MGQSGPENGTDDEDLVRRIGAGEAEALAAFYDHHAPRALGIITRVLGPGPEAEDALHAGGVVRHALLAAELVRSVSFLEVRGFARVWNDGRDRA